MRNRTCTEHLFLFVKMFFFRFDSYEKMWKWTWIEHKIEHLNLKTATINLTHCNIPFFSTWVQNNSESSTELTQIVQIRANKLNSCAVVTYFWPRDRFCVISDPNFIMEIWRNKFGFIADCIVEVQVYYFSTVQFFASWRNCTKYGATVKFRCGIWVISWLDHVFWRFQRNVIYNKPKSNRKNLIRSMEPDLIASGIKKFHNFS